MSLSFVALDFIQLLCSQTARNIRAASRNRDFLDLNLDFLWHHRNVWKAFVSADFWRTCVFKRFSLQKIIIFLQQTITFGNWSSATERLRRNRTIFRIWGKNSDSIELLETDNATTEWNKNGTYQLLIYRFQRKRHDNPEWHDDVSMSATFCWNSTNHNGWRKQQNV